jgi:hypothetical protein
MQHLWIRVLQEVLLGQGQGGVHHPNNTGL